MKKETWQLPENRDLIDWQLPPMRCFQVRVPDHPDAITAFYDSWHQLTRWTSWQRDNDKFGAVVAAAFRLGAPSPCEELEDMSDIADAIRYLADTLELNVNQNQQQTQTCGGGGGGSCLPDPLAPLPTQLDGDDSHQIFPVIPNESPDAVSQEDNYLCAVSAYLVDSWESTQAALNEQWQVVGTTAATIIAFLQEKFPGGMIVPFIASIISQLLIIGEIAYLASILDRAAESATQQKEQLREAVRNASSPLDAKRRWESVIADNRASRGRVVAGLLHLQSQLLDWDKIMGGDVNVPAEYYAECEEEEPPLLHDFYIIGDFYPDGWDGKDGFDIDSAAAIGSADYENIQELYPGYRPLSLPSGFPALRFDGIASKSFSSASIPHSLRSSSSARIQMQLWVDGVSRTVTTQTQEVANTWPNPPTTNRWYVFSFDQVQFGQAVAMEFRKNSGAYNTSLVVVELV